MCLPLVKYHVAFSWVLVLPAPFLTSMACFPFPRMAVPYLLAPLTPSHSLLHTPGFLLLCTVRNLWLRITSASLQFGNKFLYSHPSLSFCSLSEPLSEHNLSWPGLCPELKILFLYLPRCGVIISPDFYIAVFNSPPSALYGLPISVYFLKNTHWSHSWNEWNLGGCFLLSRTWILAL